MALTSTPVATATPRSRSQPARMAPTSSPSRSAWGTVSGVIMATAAPRTASEAAASQPMKPDPTTATVSPGRNRRARASPSRAVRMR